MGQPTHVESVSAYSLSLHTISPDNLMPYFIEFSFSGHSKSNFPSNISAYATYESSLVLCRLALQHQRTPREAGYQGRFGFQYGSARLGFNILSVQATYETLLIKKIVLRPQAGDFTRAGRKGGNISMKSSFARRGRNYTW